MLVLDTVVLTVFVQETAQCINGKFNNRPNPLRNQRLGPVTEKLTLPVAIQKDRALNMLFSF